MASPGEDRIAARRARLLSSVLLALVVLGTTSATFQLAVVDGFLPTFAVIAAVIGVLAVALALLRRGHAFPAAVLASVLPAAAAIGAAIANPADVFALAFASIGIGLASMFLSTRAAAILGAAVVAAIVAAPWIEPALPRSAVIAAACFTSIMTALVVVAARARDQAEVERLAEQARLHEQLLRTDRLASLGMLAASVAHEIGNPLTCASANLELLARHVEDADDRELVADARHGVDRIAAIARGLTTFARGESPIAGPADVRAAVDAAIAMAAAEIRLRARLVREYTAAPAVRGDVIGLEQVVLNLLLNAAHAIPVGDPERHEICIGVRQLGDRAEISVRDTGHGIPPDQLERIFEPFVTSKPAGTGTGLGLAICRDIVSSRGGRIDVESRVGHGSTFRVALPTV